MYQDGAIKNVQFGPRDFLRVCLKTATMLLILIAASMIFARQANAQHVNVSFQLFYDNLSPYGQWVDYQDHGYVWVPDVEADFTPYSTRGHWIYTRYGWTWVSDYRWGWAPFHYGRWDYDDYYGWVWVPDNEWGPSWVTWRRSEGYYGWAPMGSGITISLSFGGRDRHHNDHWTFVRDRDMTRSDWHRYRAGDRDRDRYITHSTIINQTYVDRSRNVTYVAGPRRDDVQRATKQSIRTHEIQDRDTPGQTVNNDRVQIYRPQVTRTTDKNRAPAPARVAKREEVKRPAERARTAPTTTRDQQQTAPRPRETTKQQNDTRQQNDKRQQDAAVKQQNDRRQQDATRQQNDKRQQDAAAKQQNDKHQQDAAAKQQNDKRQQDAAVKQQNDRRQQDAAVKQQNAARQQKANQAPTTTRTNKSPAAAPSKTKTPQPGTNTERGKKRTK